MLPDELTTTSSFRVQEGKVVDPSQRKGRIMSRRHSVGFKPETDMQVVEFEMYDEETREVFWYSKDEYDIIKARNSLIVKMMKTGHFKESNEHTFRGLEHKLKEGFRQRRANKFNGLNAVLAEQDRQYARGVIEPEAIAEKYSRVAIMAAETALVVAGRDFQNSYCFNGVKPVLVNSDISSNEAKSALDNDFDSNHDCHHQRGRYQVTDDDTIASEESTNSRRRTKIRGLFSAVSMAKRKEGKMNRRSSM